MRPCLRLGNKVIPTPDDILADKITKLWQVTTMNVSSVVATAAKIILAVGCVVLPASHAAAGTGSPAVLASATETATNLEARNESGLTPFQAAVLQGDLAAAASLADHGAKVGARDAAGNDLLHQIFLQRTPLAVHDLPPANWLARKAADPRRKPYIKCLAAGENQPGPSPLLQTASFLFACGLKAKSTNHAGQTAMRLLTGEKATQRLFFFGDDLVTLLKLTAAAGGDVNERDANGDTALHRSGQDNQVDRTAALIAAGADINATNNKGRTPLHKFAEKIGAWDPGDGTKEPFQLLLKSKPNVNAQDNDGWTPLHVLAAADTAFKKEGMQALLNAGAKPDAREKHRRTPAHLLLTGNWPWSETENCLRLLAKAGADLSAKDDQGKTLLHYLAGLGGNPPMSVVEDIGGLLITAKVDIRARDNGGDTALDIATVAGSTRLSEWVADHGARRNETNSAGAKPISKP